MCSAWGRKTRSQERRGGSRSYIPTHGCWIVQVDRQNEPSTCCMGARRRRSGEDNQAQLRAEMASTDLRGCTLTRSCEARCAIRSGASKRASNKEPGNLAVAGSRIPVIPQLTADTMRHHRTTKCAVPHGKKMRRTGRFEPLESSICLAARLKGSHCFGRRRSGTFNSTSPVQPSRSNTLGLVYYIFKTQCPRYTCTHAACIPSSALRRRPHAAQFASHIHPPGRRPEPAWFRKPQVLGHHLTALEALGRQQEQTAALPIPDLPVLPRQTCRCTLAAIPSRLAATCTHSMSPCLSRDKKQSRPALAIYTCLPSYIPTV